MRTARVSQNVHPIRSHLAPDGASSPEELDHAFCGFFGREGGGVDVEIGVFRRFVGGVDTGEVGELPETSLVVEALWIALLGNLQRGVDEDLEELPVRHHAASKVTFR